jgi:hypothetical protein
MMASTTGIAASPRAPVPLRIAAIWLALAVALLSSLIPGGLPRTTVFGSAFNPATTAVALQPTRTLPRVLAGPARRDDDPSRDARVVLAVPALSLRPSARPAELAAVPGPAARPRPIQPHDGLDGSPRGPPLA